MVLRTKSQWWGVVLDAPDARELARFYQRLLGWRIFNESADWVDLAPSEDAGYNLAFATEPHYVRPVWPTVAGQPQMSLHLDIGVDDVEEAVAHTIEVGAELAPYQPQETVRVLLDREKLNAAAGETGRLQVALTDPPDSFLQIANDALQLDVGEVELCTVG